MKLSRYTRQSQEPTAEVWQDCQALTSGADRVLAQGESWGYTRSVTWAEWPFRYMLTEFDRTTRIGILRRPRIEPVMFQLGALSAEQTMTGLVNFNQYYIGKQGVFAAFQSEVPHWSRLGEGDKAAMRESADFSIEQGLIAPNGEDELLVDFALSRARMDGVTPYYSVVT